jgi:hypothetical protein
MDSEEKQKTQNTKLQIAIDIFSVISVFYTFCGEFIWAHYYPEGKDVNGNLSIIVKIAFMTAPMCLFSGTWLLMRYVGTRLLNLRFRILFTASCLLLYLAGYLILKNTLWR